VTQGEAATLRAVKAAYESIVELIDDGGDIGEVREVAAFGAEMMRKQLRGEDVLIELDAKIVGLQAKKGTLQ